MGSPHPRLSIDEYLAWENQQVERHEFHRGEVFAMVGAKRIHACVVMNLSRALGNALTGTPCRVFSESAKVSPVDDRILYPDVFVTCDPADLRTEMIFHAPKLVVEVLSPTTQAYDRSQKFALYRRMTSLLEYGLIDPDTRRVEVFRRGADGLWVLHDMSESAALEFASVDCRMLLADLFDGVEPAQAEDA
jgi:Uma2 family endonuclease